MGAYCLTGGWVGWRLDSVGWSCCVNLEACANVKIIKHTHVCQRRQSPAAAATPPPCAPRRRSRTAGGCWTAARRSSGGAGSGFGLVGFSAIGGIWCNVYAQHNTKHIHNPTNAQRRRRGGPVCSHCPDRLPGRRPERRRGWRREESGRGRGEGHQRVCGGKGETFSLQAPTRFTTTSSNGKP
jgi:hypothetical protein